MMLTPEQLASVAVINFGDALAQTTVRKLLDHVYVQQARIEELEHKSKSLQQSLHLLMDKAVELEQDAARYRAMRCATIAASYGLGHDPVEIEIKRAMKLSSLQGRHGELTAEEIDFAVDAAMQKDKTT